MTDYTVYRTYRKKLGRPCRLFGVDFISVSQAARHFNMNYKTVWKMVNEESNQDTDYHDYRKEAA
jgi:hypothetical protein